MKSFVRNCFLLILSLPLCAIANPCDDGGIGGTGIASMLGKGGTGLTPESGGIGGTGITEAHGIGGTGITEAHGIGGTGIASKHGIGGTGIVGVITGFGSVCVNGLEVHYLTDTPIDLDGKKISSQDLLIGQVVAVKATDKGQSLYANEIHAYHQITGPVTAVNITGKELRVMGQTVFVSSDQLLGIEVGQWLNVSGLRNEDGSVVASRIDKVTGQKIARTIGNITRLANQDYLSGAKIEGLNKTIANTDSVLTGVWDGNSLKVKEVRIGPVTDLLQKVEVFHLQGLVSGDMLNGRLKLSGRQIGVTNQTKITGSSKNNNLAGKVVIMRGYVKDGKPTAQFIDLKSIRIDRKTKHDLPSSQASPNAFNASEKFEKFEEPGKIEKTEKI